MSFVVVSFGTASVAGPSLLLGWAGSDGRFGSTGLPSLLLTPVLLLSWSDDVVEEVDGSATVTGGADSTAVDGSHGSASANGSTAGGSADAGLSPDSVEVDSTDDSF